MKVIDLQSIGVIHIDILSGATQLSAWNKTFFAKCIGSGYMKNMGNERFTFWQGRIPKLLLASLSILAMGVVLSVLYPIWGRLSGMVMAVPVIVTSWLVGWQAGLAASLLGFTVIKFVFGRFDNPPLEPLIVGMILMSGISILVGWMRNLQIQLEKHSEDLLQKNRKLSYSLSETEEFSDALIKQTAELSMLLDASKAMSSTLDFEKVIRTIATEVTFSLDASGCTISNWEKDSDRVVTWIEHRVDDPELVDKPGTSYPLNDFPSTRQVLEVGKVAIVYRDDPEADPTETCVMIEQNNASLLMLPVKFREEVIALVEVDDIEDRKFTEEDVNTGLRLVEHAGAAIHNAKKFEEIQYRLKEQTLLAKAIAAITSSLDPDVALQLLCEQVCVALDATSVYVATFDEATSQSTVIAEYIGPKASEPEKVSDLGESYLENDRNFLKFIRTGVPTIDQIESPVLGTLEIDHMTEYGAKTILYLPLKMKGVPKGYIEVWESRHSREFSGAEINLGRALAEYAAVALENSYLYKKAAEAELRFKSIAKNSPDHIMLLDKDLNIRYVNYASPGLTVEQLIGTPLYSYVEESQREGVKDILQNVLDTAENNVYETEYFDSNGDAIYYESSVSPLITDEGITGLVVSSRDVSARKEMEKQLEYLALHDPLTSLPNRRFLEFRLSETMKLVARQKLRLEIAILDLDNFKEINDGFGHAIGDQVLVELGKRLKDNIRGSDFAARFGGDEFIVLFVDHRSAPEGRLQERFESIFAEPIKVQDHTIRVTASIGYSSFDGGKEIDSKTIIKHADDNMYRVKARKLRSARQIKS